jgi:hypothetical protein
MQSTPEFEVLVQVTMQSTPEFEVPLPVTIRALLNLRLVYR